MVWVWWCMDEAKAAFQRVTGKLLYPCFWHITLIPLILTHGIGVWQRPPLVVKVVRSPCSLPLHLEWIKGMALPMPGVCNTSHCQGASSCPAWGTWACLCCLLLQQVYWTHNLPLELGWQAAVPPVHMRLIIQRVVLQGVLCPRGGVLNRVHLQWDFPLCEEVLDPVEHEIHQFAVDADRAAVRVQGAGVTPELNEPHEIFPPCLESSLPVIIPHVTGVKRFLQGYDTSGMWWLPFQPGRNHREYLLAFSDAGNFSKDGCGHDLLCRAGHLTFEELEEFYFVLYHWPGQEWWDVHYHVIRMAPHHVVRHQYQ